MPIAIRALRSAFGATIEGKHYPHDAWTIEEQVTPALEAATRPHPQHGKPEIQIAEIGEDGEPICDQYFPIAGDTQEAEPEEDELSDLGFKSLVQIAAEYEIVPKPGTSKDALRGLIRRARAAKEAEG